MTITTKATATVATVATGLALAASMLSLAPIAHAATTCTFSADLTIGSTGMSVTCLQTELIAGGFSIPAGATGYFGTQTRAAVASWQSSKNIAPAVGYFGPISRAAWGGAMTGGGTSTVPGCTPGALFSSTTGASCTTTTIPGCTAGALFSSTTGQSCAGGTPSTPTGPLAGTDGSISDVSELGSYNGEDVSEGDSGVKVLGADVEASNDGDIALKSVKVSLTYTGSGGSDNLDDYIDSVDVWLGSTKIGSADVADFTEDSSGVFTKSITLSNATIRADQTAQLYISVDAVSNVDTGDLDTAAWTIDIENIRFIDGSGVTTTDTSTGGADGIDGMDVPVDFVSFATSADTELKVSTASDNPNAGVVIIDDVSNTDNVSLLKGKLKLDGTADVTLDEFPITFTAAGATLAETTGSVTLKIGGQTFTESVSSTANTASITFDNLNFDINAGDSVNFEVLADINDTDGNFGEGDTLLASVSSTNRDYMDVENSQGDQLDDSSEKSGTSTGEAQEFRVSGINLTLVSTATSVAAGTSANDDAGTFTIKFKVTAVGDAVYVSSLADATTGANTSGKTSVLVDRSGTATTGGVSVVLVNTTDTDLTSVGNYLIEEGSSETFELTTAVQLSATQTTGLFRAALGGVRWLTTDSYPVTNSYTSNLDTFKTSYINLN